MAIDPNLAMKIGQYGATQMPDYGNMLAQATNIQGARQTQQMNALKMQEEQIARQQAEAARRQQEQLNMLIPQAMTPEGSLDYGRLSQLAAGRGLYGAIPGLQTAGQELAGKRATAAKTTAETGKLTIENEMQARQLLSRIFGSTNNQEEWSAGIAELEQMFPGKTAGIPREFSTRNRDLVRMQGMTPDQLKQTPVQMNLGGAVVQGVVDPYTGRFTESAVGRTVALPEDVEAQKRRIAEAGRAQGATVKIEPGEKQNLVNRSNELFKVSEKIRESAEIATKSLTAVRTMKSLLDQGLKTGLGTGGKEQLARLGSILGMQNAANFAGNVQLFRSQAMNLVMDKQLLQKGPQTESDAKRIEQTGAQLGNETEANEFLVNLATAQFNRDIDRHNFYQKWFRGNKTYEGAEEAWLEGEGGESIFERPELKKYGVEQPAQALDPNEVEQARAYIRQNAGSAKAKELEKFLKDRGYGL
jgi:hypothetical protein